MRYQVGQKYLFIHIDYVPATVRFGNLYHPWEDKLHGFTIEELICSEHHRVPGEWDNELKYDGFTFMDRTNNRWSNQYPRAIYGQLDTSNDYRLRRYTPGFDGKPMQLRMEDLSSFMENILRGIREMKERLGKPLEGDTPEFIKTVTDSLVQFYKDINERLQTEFSLQAVNVGHTARFTDGTPDQHMPEIPEVTIVSIDKARELKHIEY